MKMKLNRHWSLAGGMLLVAAMLLWAAWREPAVRQEAFALTHATPLAPNATDYMLAVYADAESTMPLYCVSVDRLTTHPDGSVTAAINYREVTLARGQAEFIAYPAGQMPTTRSRRSTTDTRCAPRLSITMIAPAGRAGTSSCST
ncbi:MAG TPA: hypothetical protein PLG73_08665 [Candidatus Sumerlaeota bacterium]|nr:hypothetical protein [Candidatus Sumerlaeota bacterium]